MTTPVVYMTSRVRAVGRAKQGRPRGIDNVVDKADREASQGVAARGSVRRYGLGHPIG